MSTFSVTADELCAIQSSPFPCEEGKIIDPIAIAHQLGFEVVGVGFSDSSSDPAADEPKTDAVARTADTRLLMLSLASSMEASQAVNQARAVSPDAAGGAERVGVRNALDEFVDGVIASPPVVTTVIPSPGSVIVVGTVTIKVPAPPPTHPRWQEGEQIARTDLLALATRFQAASKMSGIGSTAEDLAWAASRLIDAAIAR